MPKYLTCIGVYVRTYAKFEFEAGSDEEAPAEAIATFKKDGSHISWEDTDYANMIQPSICYLDKEESDESVCEGMDFHIDADEEQAGIEREAGKLALGVIREMNKYVKRTGMEVTQNDILTAFFLSWPDAHKALVLIGDELPLDKCATGKI